jgi:hypothetical protein
MGERNAPAAAKAAWLVARLTVGYIVCAWIVLASTQYGWALIFTEDQEVVGKASS